MILPTVQLLWMTLIARLLLLLLTPLARWLIVAALTTLIEIALIILVTLETGTRTTISIDRAMKAAASRASARPLISIEHIGIFEGLHDSAILP